MKIHNATTKIKEKFKSIKEGQVSMYHCGPTVYDYIHIGNLRSFFMADTIRRSFQYLGYEVKQVMNITDVGHLVSDGDEGSDKMTKALKRHKKEITLENMLNIADFYAKAFEQNLKDFHILKPHHLPKASNHINEDIAIIKKLEDKGYTYKTSDGIYFDTKKMKNYGKLGGLNLDTEIQSRINTNDEKKFHADFALWKFNKKNGWNSPWGHGFPGWHIECSGMAMKYLGETIDIHTGGIDLKSVHHNNEIAQSECSTGKTFVNYWIHGEFLNINGEKLSKSKGGNISLETIKEKNINPIALRYLFLQSHYRSPMQFSWEILGQAEQSFLKIKKNIIELKKENKTNGNIIKKAKREMEEIISDDFNTAEALALFHKILRSENKKEDILATLYDFDLLFGFDIKEMKEEKIDIPEKVKELLEKRKKARKEKNWEESDRLREIIKENGFIISDIKEEQKIEKI